MKGDPGALTPTDTAGWKRYCSIPGYGLMMKGTLGSMKIYRCRRVPVEDLEEYMAALAK